jgi:hypothetical protein
VLTLRCCFGLFRSCDYKIILDRSFALAFTAQPARLWSLSTICLAHTRHRRITSHTVLLRQVSVLVCRHHGEHHGAIDFNLPEEMMAGLFRRLPVFPLAVDPATREPNKFTAPHHHHRLYLSILQPSIHSALSGDTPTDFPMYSTLSSDNTTNYHSILQPTIHSVLPVDITTVYPLCSLWRYSNRLSDVPYSV